METNKLEYSSQIRFGQNILQLKISKTYIKMQALYYRLVIGTIM